MHISLDSALGRQRRLNSVGESVLQIAPDAAAAYSLRSLTGGDPDVVRVRRESDNTEKDFSGSQIESGEMARWVNEQPTLPLDLRELDTNTGERDGALIEAAAAYSLRKLKEDFTADVVEVRRNVDGETEGFTADEVTDGTLESFVNASFNDELPLDQATGAAAAYSLRNLKASGTDVTTSGDTAGDTTGKYVVQTRRSSDDAVKSFTASEVADGTLEAWVNTNINVKTYDFSSNAGGLVYPSNLTLDSGQSIAGVDDALKLSVVSTGSTTVHRCYESLTPLGLGSNLRITFRAYRPSSNVNSGKLGFSFASGFLAETITEQFFSEDDTWEDFTFEGISGNSSRFYFQLSSTDGIGSIKAIFNGTTGDHVYIKDLKIDVVTSTGYVRTWYDQSGSDNHAVQTTPANQPTIVEGGVILDGINVDATNENLVLPNTSTLGISGSNARTVMAVMNSEGVDDGFMPLGGWNGTDSSENHFKNYRLRAAASDGTARVEVAGYNTPSSVDVSDGNKHLISSILSGTTTADLDISGDGTISAGSGTDTIDTGDFPLYVGFIPNRTQLGFGSIQELIIYNSDQSTKRRAIEENIANHYDITLAAFSRDGTVSTWYDQSGNTNDATQTDPTKQPKIVDGGNLQKDSRNNPAIVFDDVDDNMDLTSNLVTGGAYSAIAYHEFNAPSMILKGNLNSPKIRAYGANTYQVGSYSPEVTKIFSVPSSQGLVSVLKDASHNARVYADGTESSSGQQNVGSGSSPFQMLGTEISDGAANGKLVEFIYYESDQSDNRTAIEANIGETYGITDIPAADDTVNGFVQTWYDQSGSVPANDAVQNAADNQPKIVINGVRAVGGMRFDDNQFLETADTFTYGSGTTLSTFLVNSSDGDESAYLFRFVSDYIVYNTGGGGRRVFAGNNANAGNVTGDEELWTTISELNTAGGTSNFYVDGTLASAADAPIGTRTVSNRVLNIGGSGATTHWNGTANEVIFYATDQSSNRTDIEANIINHYDI